MDGASIVLYLESENGRRHMDKLRILAVADDPLARAGLAALVVQSPALDPVGQADSGDDLLPAVDAHRPDALIWDLGWHPETNISRASDLLDELPPTVALATLGDAQQRLRGLGWAGLLRRDAEIGQVAAALHAAVAGLVVFDPDFATPVTFAEHSAPQPVEPLTPRELEVLQLVAEGLTNRAIARQLEISEHTVKFHLNSMLGKLDAQSRTDAVVRATRAGLLLL